MRVTTLALGTAFSVLLVSGAGGAEAKKKPKLEGTWRAVSAIQNGREDKTPEEHTLTFEGKNFIMKKGDKVEAKGTFKVDSKKTPHTIDMTMTEGPKGFKDKIAKGIYQIKDDTLRWCSSAPGIETRPTEFAAAEGSMLLFVTLKREKK
jgi:uncharacterized protein (TIGR03067 family)